MDSELIIKKINSRYEQIIELYQDVPVADLWEPILPEGWSVKDTVAHIAAWVWRCAFLLQQASHSNGLLKASPDREALTQEFYYERRAWDWTRVEIDFRRAHQSLFKVIRFLPPERLSDPLVQETIAHETWEHYADHLPDLEAWHTQLVDQQILVS